MTAPPPSSPFLRHLSFFDYSLTGTITPYDSLRSALSLGFDFPVALAWCVAMPLLYGNSGPFSSYVSLAKLPKEKERTMLEGFEVKDGKDSYTRGDISALATREVKEKGEREQWSATRRAIEWVHVFNVWTLAADGKTGTVRKEDVEMFQKGELLEELARRRRVRQRDDANVLPLVRGGPIWVGGHSWFVGALFGVRVYVWEGKGRE